MAVTVNIDVFYKQQREVCLGGCTAYGQTYVGSIPIPQCKLAGLESSLKTIPTYGQAEAKGIDTSGIPLDCPNEYIGRPNREVR